MAINPLERIELDKRYTNILKLIQTQDEKNQLYSIAGVKAIEGLAREEESSMNRFASSVMKDIQSVVKASTSMGSKESNSQLERLDELVARFKKAEIIDEKQYKILKKASKLGKGHLAGQVGQRDEEYARATALSDFTYNIGKTFREVSDRKTTFGEKVGGLASAGKKRLLGGEEKLLSARGILNLTKRVGGIAALITGVVAENPALMLLGAHIQDKVNAGDELISQREEAEKERIAERIKDEMEIEESANAAVESLSTAAKEVEDSFEGFGDVADAFEDSAESVATAFADPDAESFFMNSSVFDADEFDDDKAPANIELSEIKDILTTMSKNDKDFYAQFLDMQKDKELARTKEYAPDKIDIANGKAIAGVNDISKDSSDGFFSNMIGDALGPSFSKAMGKVGMVAGPLLAVAGGAAIAAVIGPVLRDAIDEKFKAEGGLGGAIFNWVNGDPKEKEAAKQQEEQSRALAALSMNSSELAKETEKVQAEINKMITEQENPGMIKKMLGLEPSLAEQQKMLELKSELSLLKRIANDKITPTGLKAPIPSSAEVRSREELKLQTAIQHDALTGQRVALNKITSGSTGNVAINASTNVQGSTGSEENATKKLSLATGDFKSSASKIMNNQRF